VTRRTGPRREVVALPVRTDDGLALQATVTEPAPAGTAGHVVVLCHPHPLHGGTMHAPVLETVTDRLCASGVAVVRGNFRGVGRSEGSWGHGVDEVHDVRAFVAAARARYPAACLSVGGWSFGGGVALRTVSDAVDGDDGHGADWFGIAPALTFAGAPSPCPPRRAFVVVGTRDDIVTADDVAGWVTRCDAASGETVTSATLEGCDHFFVGRFAVQAGDSLADWVTAGGPSSASP
jgi:alpha/beta superfamily hydrolase